MEVREPAARAAHGDGLFDVLPSSAEALPALPAALPVRVAPSEVRALGERCGMPRERLREIGPLVEAHPLAIVPPVGSGDALHVVLPDPSPRSFVVLGVRRMGDVWALRAPGRPASLRELEAEAFRCLAAGLGLWANGRTAGWVARSGFALPAGSEALLMDERTRQRASPGAFPPFPSLDEEVRRAVEAASSKAPRA
jgi:hypothetical protein